MASSCCKRSRGSETAGKQRAQPGGSHGPRTNTEGRFGGCGNCFPGHDLSAFTNATGGRLANDAERLCDAGSFSAAGVAESVGASQPDRVRRVVEPGPCRSDGGAVAA